MDRAREIALLKRWFETTSFDKPPTEEVPDLAPEDDDED